MDSCVDASLACLENRDVGSASGQLAATSSLGLEKEADSEVGLENEVRDIVTDFIPLSH
jgi:hypothetical protein